MNTAQPRLSASVGRNTSPQTDGRMSAYSSGKRPGALRFGGVITATFLVTLFAPLFYVLIYRMSADYRKRGDTEKVAAEAGSEDEVHV